MRIDGFTPADLKAILRIEAEAFGAAAWPSELFQEYSNESHVLFLVAREGGAVAGYSIARASQGRAELESIAVAKRHRGQGIAAKLLRNTIARLKRRGVASLFLMVRRDNQSAIRLYRRLGFVRTRTVYGYYADGAAAWRMKKRLDGAQLRVMS